VETNNKLWKITKTSLPEHSARNETDFLMTKATCAFHSQSICVSKNFPCKTNHSERSQSFQDQIIHASSKYKALCSLFLRRWELILAWYIISTIHWTSVKAFRWALSGYKQPLMKLTGTKMRSRKNCRFGYRIFQSASGFLGLKVDYRFFPKTMDVLGFIPHLNK